MAAADYKIITGILFAYIANVGEKNVDIRFIANDEIVGGKNVDIRIIANDEIERLIDWYLFDCLGGNTEGVITLDSFYQDGYKIELQYKQIEDND